MLKANSFSCLMEQQPALHAVKLCVYDLCRGMALRLSPLMLGTRQEGGKGGQLCWAGDQRGWPQQSHLFSLPAVGGRANPSCNPELL